MNILEGLHNLKDRICDFENLMGAYRDAAKGKRYRNEVLDFSFNLGENLLQIQKELREMTYKVGPYREFYVRYPKPRLVMALGFRDRVVQWAIYRQINPYLDKRYIEHSYGCRQGKGTLAAAQCLHNWQQLISRKPDADDWYLIKGDISKYFYRVDHGKVLQTYDETSNDAWYRWLMGVIINNPDVPFGLPVGMKPDDCPRALRLYDVGMPIGNLTSQETANLFLDKLDKYCKHTLRLHFYD
ncbi:MAG: RNA-dependent DNA polymerase, partial [Clostridia bacterium]|nr:RNA-dependent DNA polymerase [Clostridia bacterium]